VPLAVDLDHQPAVRPVKVDLDVLDVDVHAWLGHARLLEHRVEADLVAAQRARAAVEVVGDRALEHAEVVAPVRAAHRVLERA